MRSELFDARHHEVSTDERFVLQSKRMLKVTLGADVLATKGAMVAFQGTVKFHHEGAGSVGRLIKKIVTSEDNPLMRVSGTGEVFFADTASEIFLVSLEGDGLSVNGRNLLAFDSGLAWDIKRTQGAGMLSGGLFNTILQGTGQVALTSDGDPMILDCSREPTFVDVQAAVCWSANLVPQVVNSMNMKSMLRGGSGEAFQYAFSGPGFVVVQPSEGRPVTQKSGSSRASGLAEVFGS